MQFNTGKLLVRRTYHTVHAGTACTKSAVTTDVNDVITGSYYDDTIYCPMPFQPDSYSVCCLNAADQMRCCQKDVVRSTYYLS